jgi:adenylate kinase family enzyme
VYRESTQPLIDYYRARPTYRAIDGAQSADRVAEDIVVAVAALGGAGVAGSTAR